MPSWAVLRVHEDHAVGVFHQHIAVGAHMELGDLLFIVVPQVYQQAQPTALGQLASQHQAQRFILHLHLGHLLALLGGGTKHLGYLAVPDAEGDLAILPQHYHIIYRSLMAVRIGLQLLPGSRGQVGVIQLLRRKGEALQIRLGLLDILLQVLTDGLGGKQHLLLLLVDDAVFVLQPGGHTQVQQSGQKQHQYHRGTQHHRPHLRAAALLLSHSGFLSPGN